MALRGVLVQRKTHVKSSHDAPLPRMRSIDTTYPCTRSKYNAVDSSIDKDKKNLLCSTVML